MVHVSINGGPWDRAGVQDGQWRYSWYLHEPANGQTFEVSVRATDVAGHEFTVAEQVEVDIVPPTPGEVTLTYTDSEGKQMPMVPGEVLGDAVSIEAAWGLGSGEDGPIHYAVGFSATSVIDPEDLTVYNGPGTHTQDVSAGERWYLTIDYRDDEENNSSFVAGPFIIGGND